MHRRAPLLAYFGHHKCATQWINTIIRGVCQDLALAHRSVHSPELFGGDLGGFCREHGLDFVSYTNAEMRFVRDLGDVRGFHVIRDPRDIVVSAYFSHLHSHPTEGWPGLVEHRATLQSVSRDEGLFLEMEFCRKEFGDLQAWDYSQADVLEITMESLIRSPYETMVEVFGHLAIVEQDPSRKDRFIHLLASGVNAMQARSGGWIPFRLARRRIPVDAVLGHVFRNRFRTKAEGRERGEEDSKSHYRKGVAGDWVNHFTPAHRRRFKEMYGDLPVRLGYERDSDW